MEKNSYASDHLELPEGGVDCFEGCNPYGFPPQLAEVMRAFDISRLGPYPHSTAVFEGLREYWKDVVDLEADNLMLTDGSIAAVYVVANILNAGHAKVLGLCPTFSDFAEHCRLNSIQFDSVMMRREENYRLNIDEFIDTMNSSYTAVYIDNPNNPTGQVIDCSDIDRILQRAEELGVAVIIDEAYGDLMPPGNSAIQFIDKHKNMIMLRTLSKAFGLAGLRVGYIIAHKPVISCMKKLTNPYQVSELGRELAGAALKYPEHARKSMEAFSQEKKELRASIGRCLHMAETGDTVSICTLYHDDPSVDLCKLLFEHGVLCASGASFGGLDASAARVRMPRLEDFPKLLKACIEIDSAQPVHS